PASLEYPVLQPERKMSLGSWNCNSVAISSALHKGTSDKPNTNTEGSMDIAADKSINPDEVLPEGATTNTTRTQEFVDYPPAIQRPGEDVKQEE
ncbi:hypothetical protein PN486_18285, partial [Nodularia spumigena CS-587/03]|nr:hypothetical protein [Nodularia spumigena CS-587/03]